jgi:hypothetical protein
VAITWDDARTKVRGDLWRTGTSGIPDDVCDRALHAALQDLESKRRWHWLENITESTAFVADASEMEMPSRYRSITSISVVRTDDAKDDALSQASLGRVRILASQTAGGPPSAYAISGSTIYFDGKVMAGETVETIGSTATQDDLDEAVANYATNLALQKHQAIVIAGACAWVAMTRLKNEAEAARQQVAFDRGVERLIDIDDQVRSDGYGSDIVPDADYWRMANG